MIYQSNDELLRSGLNKLLKIKDSDIRIMTLKQGYQAVDHGIHSGGAYKMSLLHLNASDEFQRKVGDCFQGCGLGYIMGYGKFNLLLTTYGDRFVIRTFDGFETLEEITIDTEVNQPNIYKCMEHGLTVEVDYFCYETRSRRKATADFSSDRGSSAIASARCISPWASPA